MVEYTTLARFVPEKTNSSQRCCINIVLYLTYLKYLDLGQQKVYYVTWTITLSLQSA